jgi:hypothetical protein
MQGTLAESRTRRDNQRIVSGLALVLAALLIASCGPEKTNLDAQREQRNEILEKNRTTIQQVAGAYRGRFTVNNTEGKPTRVDARLEVKTFVEFVQNQGTLEVVEIPRLVGILYLETVPGPREPDVGRVYVYILDKGYFRDATKTLFLQTSMPSGNGGGLGMQVFMEASFRNNRLSGTFWNNNGSSPISLDLVE